MKEGTGKKMGVGKSVSLFRVEVFPEFQETPSGDFKVWNPLGNSRVYPSKDPVERLYPGQWVPHEQNLFTKLRSAA